MASEVTVVVLLNLCSIFFKHGLQSITFVVFLLEWSFSATGPEWRWSKNKADKFL